MTGFRNLRRQMVRLLSVAAVGAAALVLVDQLGAHAQSAGPYDSRFTTYQAPSGVPMRAAMDAGSAVKATIPSGAKGIVLRWCRPEFSFGDWQFGGAKVQRALLDRAWCEASWNGNVGNVQGKMLAPE